MRTVIRGGTVVGVDHEGPADVLIEDERIAAVGRLDGVDAEVIDASGCYVLPGLIDNHTHMSMPFQGTRTSDDYDTGTRAAAAGGTTCIVDFAIQQQPGGLQATLDEWQGRAAGAAHVDYGFHVAITKADDATIADMERMVEQGITTFKVFLAYRGELMVTDDLFLQTLERSRDLGALVMVHAENGWAIDLLVRRARAAGQTEPIHHALTRPEEVEVEATARAVRFAELAGAPVYIVHVSCERAAREVAAGQARGVRVSAETCIQYLFNSIDDLRRPDFVAARYVCSPPLRDAANQARLWEMLRRRVLESCSTDHCPFTIEQKALGRDDFSRIPNGLAAIQHRLVKMWDVGVCGGLITPRELVDLTSTTIARRFGLEHKGAIAAGMDADLVIFDPDEPFHFSTQTSHMNVDYDIYDGDTASGSVRQTLCRGTVVYDRGRILTEPRSRPLRRAGGAAVSSTTSPLRIDREASARRIAEDVATLSTSRYTSSEEAIRRYAYTPEYRRTLDWFIDRFGELGYGAQEDPIGNLVLQRAPAGTPVFGLGSHCDSNRNGGPWDGTLGVVIALEVCRLADEHGLDLPLRIISWLEEEASGFGRVLLGSRVCAGDVTEQQLREEYRSLDDGRSFWDHALEAGLQPERWRECSRTLADLRGWVECHIEQGRVLEEAGERLGIVDTIAGLVHADIDVRGRSDHAGATPMGLRVDAMVVAAEIAVELERLAVAAGRDTVGVVGELTVEPGLINVVPGRRGCRWTSAAPTTWPSAAWRVTSRRSHGGGRSPAAPAPSTANGARWTPRRWIRP